MLLSLCSSNNHSPGRSLTAAKAAGTLPSTAPRPFSTPHSTTHKISLPTARRSHQQQPLRLVVQAAKKGGGGSGGGKNKKSGGLVIPKKDPYLNTSVIMHNLLLIESYYRKTGKPLFEEEIEISEAAKTLWEAPFAVLAHDTSTPEPLFVYANAAALQLFECTWDELMGKPSSASAETDDKIQSDRSEALKKVAEQGFIDNYEGWRTSLKGTRFLIKEATVFKVDAPSGENQGMSAVIPLWEYEDGTLGGPHAVTTSVAEGSDNSIEGGGGGSGTVPSDEEIAAAEAAVAAQGAAVREMKESQGLSNGSAEVQAAVEELLARKKVLEGLMKRKAAAPAASE